MTIQYKYPVISPAIEVLSELQSFIFLNCIFNHTTAVVKKMPVIRPSNEFVEKLEIGSESWQKQAWTCREIMCKYSSIPKGNAPQSDKRDYWKYIIRRTKVCPEPTYPLDKDIPYSIYVKSNVKVDYPVYSRNDQEKYVRHILWKYRKGAEPINCPAKCGKQIKNDFNELNDHLNSCQKGKDLDFSKCLDDTRVDDVVKAVDHEKKDL
jgi:hypothetical protein